MVVAATDNIGDMTVELISVLLALVQPDLKLTWKIVAIWWQTLDIV